MAVTPAIVTAAKPRPRSSKYERSVGDQIFTHFRTSSLSRTTFCSRW